MTDTLLEFLSLSYDRERQHYQGNIVSVSIVNPVPRMSYNSYCVVHYVPISGKSIDKVNQFSFYNIMSSKNECVTCNLAMFVFYVKGRLSYALFGQFDVYHFINEINYLKKISITISYMQHVCDAFQIYGLYV